MSPGGVVAVAGVRDPGRNELTVDWRAHRLRLQRTAPGFHLILVCDRLDHDQEQEQEQEQKDFDELTRFSCGGATGPPHYCTGAQ